MTQVPQGRLISGRFAGVVPVKRSSGELVEGMYNLTIMEDAPDEFADATAHRASFFDKAQGSGGRSRMAVLLDGLKLVEGEPVLVKISESSRIVDGRTFRNTNAVWIGRTPLDAAGTNGKAPPGMVTTGAPAKL
jgi:hypothetical protein